MGTAAAAQAVAYYGALCAGWHAGVGLDQLTLLRSSSLGELLETTARLTSEALELLPLQSPDEPDRPA